MKKEKIKDIMENLNIPHVEVEQHQHEFRMTLLNTKKSASIGFVLIIAPLLFLLGVITKYYLEIDFKLFTFFYDWISSLPDNDHSIISWVVRFTLIGGPLIAIAVNLLSIIHISYNKQVRELVFSIKIRWKNILIIVICTSVFLIFFSYLVIENLNHMILGFIH